MSNSYKKYFLSDSIAFRKTTERWGGLSNMARGFSLNVNNITIQSSEILYQACRFPYHPEIQEQILFETNPMIAKKIARQHIDKTRNNWNFNRVSIMKWSVFVKLCQNWDKFYYLLNSTEDKNIVEHSEKDMFWGASLKGDYYYGENVLGRILMFAREQAKNFEQERILRIAPLKIRDFKLLEQDIGVVSHDDKKDDFTLSLFS